MPDINSTNGNGTHHNDPPNRQPNSLHPLDNQEPQQQPQAQPQPQPVDILWAHQARRENASILRRLDESNATLTALSQTVRTLDVAVQQLRANANEQSGGPGRRSLGELEGWITAQVEHFQNAIEILGRMPDQMDRLRGNVEELVGIRTEIHEVVRCGVDVGVERWWEGRGKEVALGLVREEVGLLVRREMEGLGGERSRWLEHRGIYLSPLSVRAINRMTQTDISHLDLDKLKEPDLVPDSMPTQPVSSDQRQTTDTPLQTLSQTTLGSAIPNDPTRSQDQQHVPRECEGVHEVEKSKSHGQEQGEYGFGNQNGRTLAEYFAPVEAFRNQLPPRKREGRIVEVFVEGVENQEIREMLEKELDERGWMWNVLDVAVHRLMEVDVLMDLGVNVPETEQKDQGRSRKRRRIPIVSEDEADLT